MASALVTLAALAATAAGAEADRPKVKALRIVVLSTMLAEEGLGEWGFAALVEVDGERILFDTGARPRTVLENAREMGLDLSGVREVVLSHNHGDHTGGLLTLRRELQAGKPETLARAYVGRGAFWSRPGADGKSEQNSLLKLRADYESTGAAFVEVDAPRALRPGVWLTGPVARIHPERNWSGQGQVRGPDGLTEDTIPEDQSLVFDTERGLVVLTGCGHAGIVNTVEHARKVVREAGLEAVVGGAHLFPLDDARLDWTADRLRSFGLAHLLGAHCTGLEAVYRLRARAGLARATAVVGAVGSVYELGKGIEPLLLAR